MFPLEAERLDEDPAIADPKVASRGAALDQLGLKKTVAYVETDEARSSRRALNRPLRAEDGVGLVSPHQHLQHFPSRQGGVAGAPGATHVRPADDAGQVRGNSLTKPPMRAAPMPIHRDPDSIGILHPERDRTA